MTRGEPSEAGIPLQIRWLDAGFGIEIGRELRFEVVQQDESGERRLAIHRLGFTWNPIAWGEVTAARDDACVGVCRVIATAPSEDVYDTPRYELGAFVRAEGSAAVRPDLDFEIGLGPAEHPLRFFVQNAGNRREFDPRAQKRPIGLEAFSVEPAGAASVFLRDDRFVVRVDRPEARPTVSVRFPNGEVANLPLGEPVRAGAPREKAGSGASAPRPTPVASTPRSAAEPRAARPAQASAQGASAGQVQAMLDDLRRYATSFPMGEMPENARKAVRGRIGQRIEDVRQALAALPAVEKARLSAVVDEVLGSLPAGMREG